MVAALSGGVDSAVAAAMMVAAGHRVIGLTMRLYDAAGTSAAVGRCCGPRDIEDARRVCEHLGIPFYVVDFSEEFSRHVVDDFVDAYLAGDTPNPCVKCNQFIKFTPLLRHARALGAESIVTGHYARLVPDEDDGVEVGLYRGLDADKDQSYFLFSMPKGALPYVHFPLGGLSKAEVRERAVSMGLPNANKAESQEICFVPDGDYAGFVERSALRRGRHPKAGEVVSTDGRVLGTHGGLHRFTIGQRRGLGNLGDNRLKYVTRLDPEKNQVVVGDREAALQTQITVRDVRWLVDPSTRGFAQDKLRNVSVQVRHRSQAIPAQITEQGETLRLDLAEPVVAAPGQSAVLYEGERVLGGGWIHAVAS
jgi:tRNA-specific 2-thiouridylase